MEYYIGRALEVCRLDSEQLVKLHLKENNIKRCLIPGEIQEIFGLPLLKEHYGIPDHDSSMSEHNQRLRKEFRQHSLIPQEGDLSLTDVDNIHTFDLRVIPLSEDLKIGLAFQSSSRSKKKLSEDF